MTSLQVFFVVPASLALISNVIWLGNLWEMRGRRRTALERKVWSTNVSGEEADTSVAQLLDSGNFVLVQESGNILWKSFDYPTHYVLPGMKLGLHLKKGLGRFLTSWRSADDPSDWMLRNGSTGCARKRLESSSVCRSGEGFLKVEIVFLPDSTSAAVWLDMVTSHADCERECKRNCSCSAYARVDIPDKGTGCLTWYGELVDAVRVNALELAENARKSNDYLEKEIPAILIPTVSSALLVISIVAYFWRKRRGKKGTWVKNELQRSSSDQDLAFFKLSTISAATNNFTADNKLGHGGFGSVYKAISYALYQICVSVFDMIRFEDFCSP